MSTEVDREFEKMRSGLDAQREQAHRAATDLCGQAGIALVQRHYDAVNLPVVYADEAKTIPLSLPFLLAHGWRIETIEGVPILVHPGGTHV